jgi:hypothetical protein
LMGSQGVYAYFLALMQESSKEKARLYFFFLVLTQERNKESQGLRFFGEPVLKAVSTRYNSSRYVI